MRLFSIKVLFCSSKISCFQLKIESVETRFFSTWNLKSYSYHQFLELPWKYFWKVLSKNIWMIFWKLYFFNYSKINLKTNFISQLHVILTFIWCIDHTSQANTYWDMKCPKIHSKIFWRNFPKTLFGKFQNVMIGILLLSDKWFRNKSIVWWYVSCLRDCPYIT